MLLFFRRILLLLFLCGQAFAHVVSISNGELRVSGRSATYELRMPGYEMENLANPETALLDEVRFTGAKRISSECKTDGGWFVCNAQYEFADDVTDKVDVECTLYRVTVPNHVHILYAAQGGNSDQKVLDQNTSMAEMRFHPPSLLESLTRDGQAGMLKLLKSVGALLFLAAIALTARSWKDAAFLTALFFAAEWIVRPISPFIPIAMSPEFLEAVLALTAAYLAAELIFLSAGRSRWILIPLFGLIHGLRFAGFPPLYLTGAILAQAALLFILTTGCLNMPQVWRKPVGIAVFIACGLWFLRFVV